MEYKKIRKDNYTLHIIDNDRFKSMSINVFLTKEFDKNDLKYGSLLCNNMVYSCKKYNTKGKISSHGEDLFGAKVSGSFGLSAGKCESFIFTLDFLNPKYTEEKYINESIDFLCEILFNPNVDKKGFNEEYFNIIKNDTISRINAVKDNPNLYASLEYAKIMYKGTPSAYSNNSVSEEDIESISREDLYKFYKKLFNGTYKIDIVIYGENSESLVDYINQKFINVKSLNKKLSFKINHKYSDKVIEKIDCLNFNQSKLYVGYRLNDLTFYELNYVLKVYNTILGTMNDSILFNIVREENSLCYSIGSYFSKYNPALTIYAGINKDNYEKTIELVKKCVELMSDRKTVNNLFSSAKKTINTYLNSYYDDDNSQINYYYEKEFEEKDDIEIIREKINNVTIDEVIELNKKISLSTIYLLKGDNN